MSSDKLIRNKAAVVGFSYFSAGIACSSGLTAGVTAVIVSVCCIAAALVLGVVRKSPALALTLLAYGAGTLVFTAYDTVNRQPVLEQAGEVVTITGTVQEKRELPFYMSRYVVKTEIGGVSTRIILTAPDTVDVDTGDTFTADTALAHLRDTGIFPELSYNYSRNILLKGETDHIELVQKGNKTPLNYIQDYNITYRVKSHLPLPTSTERYCGRCVSAISLN